MSALARMPQIFRLLGEIHRKSALAERQTIPRMLSLWSRTTKWLYPVASNGERHG